MAKKAQKKNEQKDDEVMTEKNGIELGHKDGVTISYQSELKSFVITMPNRPDIKYQVSEKLTGVPSKVLSYTDEQIDQRLFIQGIDHEVIENTKRYMAFNNKYEVAKVDYYRPKAENTKSKQTELTQ